jgi:hypothetical protein
LRAHGITEVHAPQRMDSEGLLALPVLADAGPAHRPGDRARRTRPDCRAAAGGRRHIERADIYQRRLLHLPPRALARLAHSAQPWMLAVSSGEALQHFWQQLPPALQQRLQAHATAVVASDRLGEQARALGCSAWCARQAPPARSWWPLHTPRSPSRQRPEQGRGSRLPLSSATVMLCTTRPAGPDRRRCRQGSPMNDTPPVSPPRRPVRWLLPLAGVVVLAWAAMPAGMSGSSNRTNRQRRHRPRLSS